MELDSSRPAVRTDRPLPDSVRKVLVVGLGKVTGVAVIDAMLELGIEVRAAERDENESNAGLAERLAERGVEVIFRDEDPAHARWADLVVPSPGVPPSNNLLAAAADLGTPIWSEIEVGWRLSKGPVLAITGTNGKTTTTEMLTSILRRASIPAVAAGNIGFPLVEAARTGEPGTVLVSEVSSFQLAYVDAFRPQVAVVLNVADDHYDWHGGRAEYLAAKGRISENQQATDLLLVNAEDNAAMSIAAGSRAGIGAFGPRPPASLRRTVRSALGREPSVVAGIAGDWLMVSSMEGEVRIIRTADIRLAGVHNLQNVMAAASAALHLKSSPESIKGALGEFDALPHRMNLVDERNGTKYIDDSKATNPHAALAAMMGMSNVILIAGGRSKGIPLSPLAAAAPACKAVVVMGEAAPELQSVFRGLPIREAASVEEAVIQAADLAEPGDTVLLSPGCSSLDQYGGYAERGDRFVRAVKALR